MTHATETSSGSNGDNGPRAILRVTEVLNAVALRDGATTLAELSHHLRLPRSSLQRLLQTLERGGFLSVQANKYMLGPESFQLANRILQAADGANFPNCARSTIERLAAETGETVILGVLSESRSEIVYADVIIADTPLRYAVPKGDRRPLYSSASGKAVLAFFPADELERYIETTRFVAFTRFTTRKDELRGLLENVRATGVMWDRDGQFVGAGAAASPLFRSTGEVFGAVVAAGPTERLDRATAELGASVFAAGESISRILGYVGPYPPSSNPAAPGAPPLQAAA